MEYAYDPRYRDNVTVARYKDRYGPKRDRQGTPRPRPVLQCLACHVSLHTVAEDLPTSVPTWGHDPRPNTFCPVKAEGVHRYEMLPPKDADPVAGAALRAEFFEHWESHWGYVRTLAPYPEIQTFVGFLRSADQSGFWNYRNLEVWHIPYVFLSTCDFPPPAGKAGSYRKDWLRFRFDGRFKTLADLWIEAQPGFEFLRLIYKKPLRKPEPGPSEFILAEPIRPNPNWLANEFAGAHAFAIKKMSEAFPKEVSLSESKKNNPIQGKL